MNETFVAELKRKVLLYLGDTDKNMAQVCLAIIEHVSVAPSKKPHLTFLDLYRISPKVDENIFYEAVFFLTRNNINVLDQQFQALNPRTKEFQPVPNRNELIESMRDGEFYNPFVGELLDEEGFGKQVLTYFSPSKYFMERLDG
ncbi:MAG: hypothetical protein Q4P13_11570 [Psychrobacter sp.]|nr:hypothetical protein [Psychrobacter sp.]